MTRRLPPSHLLALALLLGPLPSTAVQENAKPLSDPYRLQLRTTDYQLVDRARKPKSLGGTPVALKNKPYASQIERAARKNQLDPALVHAVIHVESRHSAEAVSPKGALGLMQVMPETAERFGVKQAASPEGNLAAGTRYLRTLLDRFDQRLDLALAAYNAGEGAVIRHQRQIPPYQETRQYVPAVLSQYDEWRQTDPLKINYLSGTRLDKQAIAVQSRSRFDETTLTFGIVQPD